MVDLAKGSRIRRTFDGATYLMPSWSADGQRVVYVALKGSVVSAGSSLRSRLANGGGQEEILMEPGQAGGSAVFLQWLQW